MAEKRDYNMIGNFLKNTRKDGILPKKTFYAPNKYSTKIWGSKGAKTWKN
jgi:hypothetical protein